MNSTSPTPSVSIQRRRPIDASGLFWLLVSILAGFFYGGIGGPGFYVVSGTCALACVVWQVNKWSLDWKINRQATEWCRLNYPTYGDTPIVDFTVALAQSVSCDFEQLHPSTSLEDLNRCRGSAIVHLYDSTTEMLEVVVSEARMRRVDWTQFSGSTLDDAINFVVRNRK